ncbi:phenylacetate--CoA ligase family protein [Ruminiclostridium papyrosolvens]|uniref:Coenzyme F390 synthetase n=1 Tax=Ruminiclostridium papyrosolvens C7 TaxID=1330534 RepID=U4QZB0_9FIRM|nr:phenylacetate--CoA ligase family protein [Ruminiclostridium papyrosolvens]EPR10208.1 hypothetical protein L323_14350 [Ruminiclostridium papyrosolvens C7]
MMKQKLWSLAIKSKSSSIYQMASYASQNTKFYNNYYKRYNTDDFESLPILTKYNLVGVSPYDLLSQEFKDKVYLYGETSGSSGAPTPSFFTKKDFEGLISLSSLTPYIKTIKEHLKKNRTAVNGLTFGYTVAGFSFGALLQMHGAMVAQLGTRSTIGTPVRTAATIVKLQPGVISATPLDFMSWAEIIRKDYYPLDYEKTIDNIKVLLSTAEPCADSRQHQIEKHFSLTHVNTYASVDGFFSLPCPCGEKHLIDGINYIELFNHKMKPLGANGKGRLCFTSLMRKTTPMVRYMLDDLITITDSKCEYGFKKSVKPHGRYELSLELNNQTWGNLDFEEIIYKYGLFMDYKVYVTDNSISVELEEYPIAKGDYDLSGLENELSASTGMNCVISLHPLGYLTDCWKIREAKSIVKVIDQRLSSRQTIPQIL